MTVRLGFAVAAFLEPEILVVDEVLAVGDAEFQKKAIGKCKMYLQEKEELYCLLVIIWEVCEDYVIKEFFSKMVK